jgi:adenylate kinase
MAEVIYLTGAPASGKSSLTKALKTKVPDLEIFEFGERLTARLSGSGQVNDQADLRAQSARTITLEDVRAQLVPW